MARETGRLAPRFLAELRAKWPERERRNAAELRAFERRLRDRWGEPLSKLDLLTVICRETGEEMIDHAQKNPEFDSPVLLGVLSRLHARACQVATEIGILLAKGFADGAMARWRTLHEISVVAMFIADHGETLAQRYVDHLAVDAEKSVKRYTEFQGRAKLRPYTTKQRETIARNYQVALAKYGAVFKEDFGWGVGFLSKPNPSPKFDHIEREVGRDHLRPYYRFASQNVHAFAKGAFSKLGLPSGENVLMAGASNFGISTPGQSAAISLPLATMALIKLGASFDALLYIKVASRLMDATCRSFARVGQQLDKEMRQKKRKP